MFTMMVVDDEYLVRTGITQIIDWDEFGVQIVGEASDGVEGLELAISLQPDIIVTDIRMPFMDGLEFMDKIRERGLKSAIIVLSGYDEFDYVRTAMHNGAYAYLLKPVGLSNLTHTVRELTHRLEEERKIRKYYENLENEIPSIRQQFLLNLIRGNLTNGIEIEEKCIFTKTPICKESNIVIVICVQPKETSASTTFGNNPPVDRSVVTSHISYAYLYSEEYSGIVFESNMDEWVAIIHAQQVTAVNTDFATVLHEISKYLLTKLKKIYNINFSAGISTQIVNTEGIHNAYMKASNAARKQGLADNTGVLPVSGEDIPIMRREIRKALEYIKSHFNQNITVEKLARELFISPSHLMYLFRVELNKTFNECLIEYRIEAAKELLKDTPMRINEVCSLVGYDDSKYFSQIFKRLTGYTPSEYIKKEG